MHFENVIYKLQKELAKPLPGLSAHKKFMHADRLKHLNKTPRKIRKSAVLILLYPYKDSTYIPLILRPKYDGTHGGQMALPGGKEEPEDENLIRTALREAQEEIGIRTLDVTVLGELTEVYIPVSNFIVQPVVGYVNFIPDFFPDPREVDKVYKIDLDDLLKADQIAHKKIKIGNSEVVVPGFDVQNTWIWGATSLIISELVDILKAEN